MATTNAHTLEEWISDFRRQLNVVSDFVHNDAVSDGTTVVQLMDETVLSKYDAELRPYLTRVTLTDRERQLYQQNPRLLSYDLYGAPEFWYLILYANELHSLLEFDLREIKFYKIGVIDVLNQIRQLESPYKDENEQVMTDVVVDRKPWNTDILVDDPILS